MKEDFQELIDNAMLRAWQLGQTYWQQADSESYAQNRRSGETQKKFDALVDAVREATRLMTGKAMKETFKWEYNRPDPTKIFEFYLSGCGKSYVFFVGTLEANDFKFCPFCGKEIS